VGSHHQQRPPVVWVVVAEIALVLASTTTIPAATADMSVATPSAYAAAPHRAPERRPTSRVSTRRSDPGPDDLSLQTTGTILAILSTATVAILRPTTTQPG
jgi:hypothetical protein